ncbi:t-cell acute lymphocytic leukemia [Lynx pardinus]|uniref:T-cell acute lymphocytic leukemia n=1 Tax=Lynx pardinus TaxID=191816 RepID=A0A485NP32_LYNPA|nr:t-cell acute lymphocytic leukemia [Lynx pardinus]
MPQGEPLELADPVQKCNLNDNSPSACVSGGNFAEPRRGFRSGFFGEPDAFPMFATNNRVKRRPSPYEMEITDGECTCFHLCVIPHAP